MALKAVCKETALSLGNDADQLTCREIAALLWYRDMWRDHTPPASVQLCLYKDPSGGQYRCAVKDCGMSCVPRRGRDLIVVVGPFTLCHEHGRYVVGYGRHELGLPQEFKFHYLSVMVDRIERREAEVGDQTKARNEKAREEVQGRRDCLNQACDEAAQKRGMIAAEYNRVFAATREATGPARNAPRPQQPEPFAASSADSEVPDPEYYAGLTARQRASAMRTAKAGLKKADQMRVSGVLSQEDHAPVARMFNLVLERIKTAQRLKELDKLKQAQIAVGIGVAPQGPRVERARSEAPAGSVPGSKLRVIQGGARVTQPLQFACSACAQVRGDPGDRLEAIRIFNPSGVTTSKQAFALLGETAERWRDLLLMHAPDDASEGALRDSQSRSYKDAKHQARACLLHGPETRALGRYRYAVICHIQAKWPEMWKTRKQEDDAAAAIVSSVCQKCGEKGVKRHNGSPLCKACKNRATASNRAQRRAVAAARNRAAHGALKPNEGSGLLDQRSRGRGGKQAGKK